MVSHRPTEIPIVTTSLLHMARFTCPPGSRQWRRENLIRRGPLIAFPRVPVIIEHAGGEPVVADANRVMLYNDQQVYRRGLVDERGDVCDFVVIREDVVREIVGDVGGRIREDGALIPFSDGPCPPDVCLRERLLCRLVRTQQADNLAVEESLLELVRRLLEEAHRVRQRGRRPRRNETRRAHRDLVEETRLVLGRTYRENLTIDEVASRVHVSPYHLCRVFRAGTGQSVSAFRNQLRLRASLERLADGADDLTSLAMSLGYASHSHFTNSFRSAFGITPSAFRSSATTACVRGAMPGLAV